MSFGIVIKGLDWQIDGAIKTAALAFLVAWAVFSFAIYISSVWDRRRPWMMAAQVGVGIGLIAVWWAYLPSPPATVPPQDKAVIVSTSDVPTPDTVTPTPYILTRLVIDSVSKDNVVFHLHVDNGDLPIRDIRTAYSTNNFNVDPETVTEDFFEISTFMPRRLPPRGALSIPGKARIFTRDKQTSLTVMIGYRAETGATTGRDFTALYRFLIRPEDMKPQVIHPEGVETKEQKFNDEAMQSVIAAKSFLLTKGMISFVAPETTPDGSPVIVGDENEYRKFLFDSASRLVTFQMKTRSGKSITLELPLLPSKDKEHKVSLGWDYSRGGYLLVDQAGTDNFKGKARKFKIPVPTPKREHHAGRPDYRQLKRLLRSLPSERNEVGPSD